MNYTEIYNQIDTKLDFDYWQDEIELSNILNSVSNDYN